jgi:hypothetical protein
MRLRGPREAALPTASPNSQLAGRHPFPAAPIATVQDGAVLNAADLPFTAEGDDLMQLPFANQASRRLAHRGCRNLLSGKSRSAAK